MDICKIRPWGVYPPWEAELHLWVYGGPNTHYCTGQASKMWTVSSIFANPIALSLHIKTPALQRVKWTCVLQGYLMKKGRENNQFLPRKFVLSEIDNTIKYYVKVLHMMQPFVGSYWPLKDRKDPKAVIKISDINVAFSPTKIPFPNSLQIDYLKVNLTYGRKKDVN